MATGAPCKYKPEYCDLAHQYLESKQDKMMTEEVVKNGNVSYRSKLIVNLPSVGDFASKWLKVSRTTVYDWCKKYPEFSCTIEDIKTEQETRLLNEGLAGIYNATIAKLLLIVNHGMGSPKNNS